MAIRLKIAVFATALVLLGFNIQRVGLAEAYVDPIAHIPAQDEAVYSSTALHMAESGGWLTPVFLGRYALYKPPLLYWVAGFSVKLFGPSALALRLPSLLAGAGVALLLFTWIWRAHSLAAAASATLLLITDRVFFTLARVTLTDMPLLLWIVIALYCVYRDPGLATRRSLWIFGGAVGAAIMTKGVAGFLPLMMLAGTGRIGFRRFMQVCGVGALIAAPWHAYQLAVHTRWFWAEYILTEHFTWALAAPSQSTQENQLFYYLKRLALLDPVLCVAALAGIPFAIRTRNRLLLAWFTVVILALIAFGYRNTSYLLLLIPALCLLAAGALRNWSTTAVVALLACLKLAMLPYQPEHPMPSVAALKSYAALGRTRDLILISPDDEFVSSTLPLRHVRYCFLNTHPDPPPLPLDFRYLGIALTVPEFNDFARLAPVFAQRLAEFGLASSQPVGTVILARSPGELVTLIAGHPESDFSVPTDLGPVQDASHIAWNETAGRFFLLAR